MIGWIQQLAARDDSGCYEPDFVIKTEAIDDGNRVEMGLFDQIHDPLAFGVTPAG